MSKETAFWDSSGLVPLCLEQAASPEAQSYMRRFTPMVWWGSSVEVRSAMARLRRMGRLKDVEKNGALARLDFMSRGWREVLPTDELRALAFRLLDMYELCAADSLQLAAALTWCQERPAKRNFICGDIRLSKAAVSAGFSVLELASAIPK